MILFQNANNDSLKSLQSFSGDAPSSPSLSRDSSTDNKADLTPEELRSFITETCEKSLPDRILMLKVEKELVQLIKDPTRETHRIMSSKPYQRMLIHRAAAYFCLEHNVDPSRSSVIITKTAQSHIPELKFKDLYKSDDSIDEPKKLILKRSSEQTSTNTASSSQDDSSSPSSSFDKEKIIDNPPISGANINLTNSFSDSSRKSLEEREENYERVRARIFKNESEAFEESCTDGIKKDFIQANIDPPEKDQIDCSSPNSRTNICDTDVETHNDSALKVSPAQCNSTVVPAQDSTLAPPPTIKSNGPLLKSPDLKLANGTTNNHRSFNNNRRNNNYRNNNSKVNYRDNRNQSHSIPGPFSHSMLPPDFHRNQITYGMPGLLNVCVV